MRKLFLLLFGVVFFATAALAQRTITGKVTDEKGIPVANASVLIKGTNAGTSTKADGSFNLAVPADGKALIISSVGFIDAEFKLGTTNTISVSLVSENKAIEEVVVVAYGTQKKGTITGSISKIDSSALQTRQISNISQALAGAAPGIAATSGNGQPGSGAAIRIRGFGSINASSEPLYVVDGFPYGGFIGDINTNDIESISLLKDASSTALYGARAANGVVLVTTKKGRTAVPRINVYVNYGQNNRGIAEYDRVNTLQYYPLIWQGIKNGAQYPVTGTGATAAAAAQTASNTVATQLIYNPFNVPGNQVVNLDGSLNTNAALLYNDFDWYTPLERNGPRVETGFSVSSKIAKSDYFFSLNYLTDKGFVIESDFKRINARMAINSQVKDWLKTGINVTTAIINTNQAAGDGSNTFVNPFVFARGIGPIFPVRAYTTTGQPIFNAVTGEQWYDYGLHPGAVNRPSGASPGRHIILETLLNKRLTKRNSIIARTFLEAKLAKFLTFTTNVGVDLNNTRALTFQNRTVGDGVTPGGRSTNSANEFRTITLNQLLNFNKKFGNHDIAILAGHESSKTIDEYITAERTGAIADGNIQLANFVTATQATGNEDNLRRDAYLSRFNYSYKNKLNLDVSYRRDVSSRFSPKSRWGNFYSIGGAWAISEESFVKNSKWINYLKLRASYGTVGNDALGTYYEYQALYGLGFNNAGEPGVLATRPNNPDLTWEVNVTKNVGLEFGILKNRISGSIEYFDRGSSELLFDVPQGLSSIITTITQNIGTMSNKGIELQLNLDVVKSKSFNWDVQFNITSLKNNISKLPNNNAPITSGTKRLEVGKDIFAFYLRRWYGVDPTDGAGLFYANSASSTDIRTGPKGEKLTNNPSNADFGYAGTAIPKHFGSINNTFTIFDLSISCLLNYQVGGKFYDGNYAGLMGVAYGSAMHTDLLNAWKKPGDITNVPRLDINQTNARYNAASDRWLIDASYLNIRNVSVNYNVPKSLTSKLKVESLRVFVGGENLLILSKRQGLNPAESFNGTNSPVYTPNRLINFGFNMNF
jgi:TonB-linked SusC/RagA family outer membrane protein